MKLDKHSSVPLYYQLKEQLLENIESGVYKPGSKLDSEILLCEKLGLSRPTVRQAISELVFEGKLQIIKGKGTFVMPSSERIEIKNFSGTTFSFLCSQQANKSEIEDYYIVKDVDDEVQKAFGDESFCIAGYTCVKKIIKKESEPYIFTCSYIPVKLFPSLSEDIKNERLMIDITVNRYAYVPVKSTSSIFVNPANSEQARALDVAKGTLLLSCISRLISRSGSVSEVVVCAMRPDMCEINI